MENYLEGVRCIANTNNYSLIELTTTFYKKIIRLVHTTVAVPLGQQDRYEYSLSIKDYCKLHNIKYKGYLNMLHRDCE